jgi:hypothetical protein
MNINKKQFINSNNSSKITQDNSNILSINKNQKYNNRYLNSSIFESRNTSIDNTTKPIKSQLYLTEVSDFNNNDQIIPKGKSVHIMGELFDFKPTTSGRILPHVKRKPPTMIYCCDEKYEANNLSNLYDKYWVHPPEKKMIINFKRERTKVRDTSYEYIEKTKSIILARYNLKIKEEAKKRIENNIKNEIKSLDNTIRQINRYKDDLENNFIQKYDMALRNLNIQYQEERTKNENLNFHLIKMLKEVNILKNQLKKVNTNKVLLEKWIIFQIQMDKGYIPSNLKETLKNEYNNELIFQDIDDFDDWFVRAQNKNLKLLDEYNIKKKECDDLKKEFLEDQKLSNYEKMIESEVQEKEKLLVLLKLRNKNLEREKKDCFKSQISSPKKVKKIQTEYEKPKKLKDSIYIKVKCIYNKINEELSNELKNINLNKEIDRCISKGDKTMKMIIAIEITLNFLISKFHEYKSDYHNNDILKSIQEQIDLEHKIATANQRKLEEENKIEELKKNINKRDKKFIYVPKRKVDMFPFALYQKQRRTVTEKDDKKNELNIFDFLFDNDEKV